MKLTQNNSSNQALISGRQLGKGAGVWVDEIKRLDLLDKVVLVDIEAFSVVGVVVRTGCPKCKRMFSYTLHPTNFSVYGCWMVNCDNRSGGCGWNFDVTFWPQDAFPPKKLGLPKLDLSHKTVKKYDGRGPKSRSDRRRAKADRPGL